MKIKKITSLFFVLTFALAPFFLPHYVQAEQAVTPEQATNNFYRRKSVRKNIFRLSILEIKILLF